MPRDRRRESERRSAEAGDALAADAPPRGGGGLGERLGLLGHEADTGARPARRLLASLRLRPSTDGRFHAAAAAAGEGLRQLGGHPGVGARGRDGVEAAVRAWPKPKEGEKPTGRERARVGLVAEEPEALAEASAAARRSVRGERVARLG